MRVRANGGPRNGRCPKRRSRTSNPKGIVSSSPRLRGTSYLGLPFGVQFNRNAVVALRRQTEIGFRHNPVGVGIHGRTEPRRLTVNRSQPVGLMFPRLIMMGTGRAASIENGPMGKKKASPLKTAVVVGAILILVVAVLLIVANWDGI